MPIDSTTIHIPSSSYPDPGIRNGVGWVTIPGVPDNLLTGSYGAGADYAGTYIDNATVMTFPNTDLVITQPTPFDQWMRIGIYTETPNASIHSSSDFSVWPASICGTYSTSTEYSTTSWTVGTGLSRSLSYSSTPTATYTQLQPSDPSNRLRFLISDPMADSDYIERLDTLDVGYIQAKNTQFTEPSMQVALPTGFMDWLATQEEVIKKYPYITNCWMGPKGEGQPTVHVPVMALTVTSSHMLGEAEPSAAESPEKESTITLSKTRTSTIHTIVTVKTATPSSGTSPTAPGEMVQSTSETTGPEATGTRLGEEVKPSPISESASREPDLSEQQHATNEDGGQTGNNVDPAALTKPQSTASSTVEAIGNLVSAIHSVVVQQGGASQETPALEDSQQTTKVESAAVDSTAVPSERPHQSVTGFAIGSQTASPGGEAVTRGGSVYSALPSGSGLRVEADGQTSRITDTMLPGATVAQGSGTNNDYIVGDNTLTAGGPAIISDGKTISALSDGSGVRIAASDQTRIVPAATVTDSVTLRSGDSEDEYIFAGNTLSAGDDAFSFAGVTYSALTSGSGVIIIADDSTSTASAGQAIELHLKAI